MNESNKDEILRMMRGAGALPPQQPPSYAVSDDDHVFDDTGIDRFAFKNDRGLLLKGYRWTCVGKPKGMVVAIHGICSHSRLAWLRSRTWDALYDKRITDAEKEVLVEGDMELTYRGSWVETLNQFGLDVYALDIQGHGLSEAYGRTRLNVERFDDFVDDTLSVLRHAHEQARLKWQTEVPVYLVGYSLGGLIAARTVTQCIQDGRIVVSGAHEEQPSDDEGWSNMLEHIRGGGGQSPIKLAGTVLISPAFRVPPIEQMIARLGITTVLKKLSEYHPHATVYRPSESAWGVEDSPRALLYSYKDPLLPDVAFPARLTTEIMETVPSIVQGAEHVGGREMPLLIVHGEKDGLADIKGSEQFLQNYVAGNKSADTGKLIRLPNTGHAVTREPGGESLGCDIGGWLVRNSVRWRRRRTLQNTRARGVVKPSKERAAISLHHGPDKIQVTVHDHSHHTLPPCVDCKEARKRRTSPRVFGGYGTQESYG
eukprot:GHVO01054320.1.p1 GENE.GHVO01054320.1~~GHVO01054320.1.p1  ORF type:complete len:484 (+),score=76.99 GHVO01054320.1:150-1601(+)